MQLFTTFLLCICNMSTPAAATQNNLSDAKTAVRLLENTLQRCGIATSGSETALKMDDFHALANVSDGPESTSSAIDQKEPGLMPIHVKTLRGTTITIKCSPNNTIEELKLTIGEAENIPPSHALQQMLKFAGKFLENSSTIKDYKIGKDYTLYLNVRVRGGADNSVYFDHWNIDVNIFQTCWNWDATNVDDTGKTFKRGNVDYFRPVGCYRFALRVLGKYEDGDDWINNTGTRGWVNAFHGTSVDRATRIAVESLKKNGEDGVEPSPGPSDVYGNRVYVSPDFRYAASYARQDCLDGKYYKLIFQCRVRPGSYREENTRIWTVANNKDIRPYGICYLEM